MAGFITSLVRSLCNTLRAVYQSMVSRRPLVGLSSVCRPLFPLCEDLKMTESQIPTSCLRNLRYAAVALFILVGVGNAWGAVTPLSLPKTWGATDGKDAYTEALGCSQNGLGSDYSASGTYLKFDGTGDYLIIQLADAPSKLTYNIKGNDFSGGTFTVQQSSDGSSYSNLASYTSISNGSKEHSLASTTRYIKFIYTTKSSGNVGLGTIGITKKPAAATITLNNYSGSATTTGYYSGDDFTLPSTNSYTCGTKTFVGWSTVEVAATNTKPTSNFYEPGEEVTLGATNTFYAVFADVEVGDDEWVLCSSVASVTTGTYVITGDNSVYLPSETTVSKNPSATSGITVSDNKLTNTVTSAMQWTFTGNNSDGWTISHTKSGTTYYLGSSDAAQGILVTTSNSSYSWIVSLDNTKGMLMNGSGSRYLSYRSTSSDWRNYASSDYVGTLRLYKKTVGTTYSNYVTICCTPLGQINGSFLLAHRARC